jgi:hypothetical protein
MIIDIALLAAILWSMLVMVVACGEVIASTDWTRRADIVTTLFAAPGILVAVVALILMARAPFVSVASGFWAYVLSLLMGGI